MNNIKLSICIPIYNFGNFIAETLDSILVQLDPEDEIIVLDGGSQDHTQTLLNDYAKKHLNLHYHRFEKRGGIDVDIEKSVALAHGDYCWLFGGDDIMLPGSIAKIKKHIQSNLDVYLCGFEIHSLDMKKFLSKHPMFNVQKDTIYDLSNLVERKRFFKDAINSTAFFSYMSALVIKRDTWQKAGTPVPFMDSCLAHAARLFNYSKQHDLKIQYLNDVYLNNRSGNDSFRGKGLIHRFGIGIHAYIKMADLIFGHYSFESFQIQRTQRNEFPLQMLIRYKASNLSQDDLRHLHALTKKLYCHLYPFNIHKYLIFLLSNRSFYYLLRSLKSIFFCSQK